VTSELVITASQRTVGEALSTTVTRRGPCVALESGARSWTFFELNADSNRLANALLVRGLGRGDRIAVVSENRPEYAFIFHAAAKIGVATCPMNWRLSPRELCGALESVDPRLVFVSERHQELFNDAVRSNFNGGVVLLDGPLGNSPSPFDELVASGSIEKPDVLVSAEDILFITYTSGTTGEPKGVMISHRALIARAMGFAADQGWVEEEAFVAWSPIFHIGGLDGLLVSGVIGGKCIVVDGMRSEEIAQILLRERVNWLFLPPGGIRGVVEDVKRAGKPKGVRLVGSMADLLPPSLIAETTLVFGAPFFNSYACSEARIYPCATSIIPVGEMPTVLSKRQSAFCDVRIVDEDGDDVALETPGELLLRGPMLFSGYHTNSFASGRDFSDGWFQTGDILVRHEDGTLDFVERKAYMIKSGGENIYPAEIERLLIHHPAVLEATVVKRSDAQWGEVPIACVAVSDPTVGEGVLLDFLDGQLARYKRPREFHFLAPDDFERNLTGKVIRSRLETLIANRSEQSPLSSQKGSVQT
jgi:fatty-acyl-CoA synthase